MVVTETARLGVEKSLSDAVEDASSSVCTKIAWLLDPPDEGIERTEDGGKVGEITLDGGEAVEGGGDGVELDAKGFGHGVYTMAKDTNG